MLGFYNGGFFWFSTILETHGRGANHLKSCKEMHGGSTRKESVEKVFERVSRMIYKEMHLRKIVARNSLEVIHKSVEHI